MDVSYKTYLLTPIFFILPLSTSSSSFFQVGYMSFERVLSTTNLPDVR